jgi:glucose/mannose-6-phosphate isomerase
VLSERLERPLATVRGYELPSWTTPDWAVVCSSYSGGTEETLACFDAAGTLGSPRLVLSTGGTLVERAREQGVPVVGLPGILQPRAAVGYVFAMAAEAAALFGAGPRIADEIEAAAGFLAEQREQLAGRAGEIAARLEGTLPVIHGSGPTAPVAGRWKTQLNENAKLHAFHSVLPEADHNEICGWGSLPDARLSAVMLEDEGQHPRMRRRFELTAEAIAASGAEVVRIDTEGEGIVARVLWSVMLGDLVSLRLAESRGVDPLSIEALEALKSALAES